MDKHVGQQGDVVRSTLDAYLSEHPDACDTIEGIRMWWLHGIDTDMMTIERVLNDMVEAGVIERIRLGGNVVVFRRAAHRDRDGG